MEALVFTASTPFNGFVEEFINRQIKYMSENNKGGANYCKMMMNASFGYDGLNLEKYDKVELNNKTQDLNRHWNTRYVGSRQITDDLYLTCMKPDTHKCNICIQESFFKLDNAKYWYLNYYYNFMMKAFDFNRIHFIEGDTDSMYFAVAGDKNLGVKQGFGAVIKDQKFLDENAYLFFPNPKLGVLDEKKLLGVAVEKEGDVMIALGPKNYYIKTTEKSVVKGKGVSSRNKIGASAYVENINEQTQLKGTNVGFHVRNNRLVKESIEKKAITGIHTKMVTLSNNSCAPFVFGIKPENYIVKC
jgi:hypothetical protein